MRYRSLMIAGVLCLFTTFLHLIGGQISLVNTMLSSDLIDQVKGELTGAWHIVTIVLCYSSLVLLSQYDPRRYELLKFIGTSFILFGLTFVGTSLYFGLLTPQFILLIPIGTLILFALSQLKTEGKVAIDS